MKLLNKTISMTLILAHVTTAHAAFNRGTGGAAAANFLRLGAGARYLAMGESATAIADDVNALYWNPANLGRLENGALTLMQNNYASADYQFAGIALPTREMGSFGASLQRFSYGDINGTDQNNQDTGSFSPRDLALGLGWGRQISGNWQGGMNAKFIQSKIVDTASTFAFDAGLGYRKNKVSTGATIRNMGGKLKFDNEGDSLPLTMQAGVGYRMSKAFLLSSDLALPQDAPSYIGVGAEYRLGIGRDFGLGMRGGYNTRGRTLDGLSGFTFGLGFQWSSIDVDYAWIPIGNFEDTHRFSLNVRFPTAPKTQPIVKALPVPPVQTAKVKDPMEKPAEIAQAKPKLWILRDVKFDFNSDKLKPESMAALDQAIFALRENPHMKVEVQGHTDNVGRKVYNLDLSQRRALAVMKYLIQEGVPAQRLTAKGYGDQEPLIANETEAGRAINRRMQFKVVEK